MMTMMETEKLVKVVADTRTADGTKAVYGGPYPGGVIYATPATIEKNPQAVQKVVDAFVRGLRWIASHSAEDIAKLMPEEYALGNLPIYIKALSISKAMYSPDGHFEPGRSAPPMPCSSSSTRRWPARPSICRRPTTTAS